jgi:hypothetical protein
MPFSTVAFIDFRCVRKMAKGDYLLRHVCQSILPHGKTRFALERFSLNLIFECFFLNLLRKFKFYSNRVRITSTLHELLHIFLIIPHLIFLIMRNISDKSCRENPNTHITFNFFSKILMFLR